MAKWVNKNPYGWFYEGHGWGVYWVKRAKNGQWYAFHEEFGGKPVGLGNFPTRPEAQALVEATVSRLAESKVRKNPVRGYSVTEFGPKFDKAIEHFTRSVMASKEHSSLVESALNKYGDHGPQISGIVREHFPESVKYKLRDLARKVTAESDAAWAARPKGVRDSTMRKLSQAVAKLHGSGFYGPQPPRSSNPMRRNRARKPMSAAARRAFADRMAAARAAKGGRRGRRTKTTVRRVNPSRPEYMIVAIRRDNGQVFYWKGMEWGINRAWAAKWDTQNMAKSAAQDITKTPAKTQMAVCPAGMTEKRMREVLQGKQ